MCSTYQYVHIYIYIIYNHMRYNIWMYNIFWYICQMLRAKKRNAFCHNFPSLPTTNICTKIQHMYMYPHHICVYGSMWYIYEIKKCEHQTKTPSCVLVFFTSIFSISYHITYKQIYMNEGNTYIIRLFLFSFFLKTRGIAEWLFENGGPYLPPQWGGWGVNGLWSLGESAKGNTCVREEWKSAKGNTHKCGYSPFFHLFGGGTHTEENEEDT